MVADDEAFTAAVSNVESNDVAKLRECLDRDRSPGCEYSR